MRIERVMLTLVLSLVTAMAAAAAGVETAEIAGPIDWPVFMAQHDMHFDTLPRKWTEAPHFGNAAIGSMLYQDGNTIRLQVFRNDVHDHRDDTWGWPAYSRARLRIGHFALEPVGNLTGCQWRKDLWNAELTGTITTDRGEIKIRHFVHAVDMAIVTELTPSAGEQGCKWTWHPREARTSRPGYPTEQSEVAGFAKRYGEYYTETLQLWKPNPAGRQEEKGKVSIWIQDFLVGGQYATAWGEQTENKTRTHVASIAHSYPNSTAAATAAADVARCMDLERDAWMQSHRDWWHSYYPRSYVSIPDQSLESLYWQTIYRFGCTSRAGRYFVDTSGIWFQGGPWAYTTTNWNIQSAHWPVYAANRLEQGEELMNRFHQNREALIQAVRPAEWQADSALLAHEVASDMAGNREQDMRYYNEIGNLPWALNNCWSQYRYSMDDTMLREQLYPLLRRSVNLYLHTVEEGADGKLHLPPTYSPETGEWKDCNFDLALFKWGCLTLLRASKRLGIDDPLIPRWKEVAEHLVDFPADEFGFRLGSDRTSSPNHRHFSNLLMIYPLYLVNIEQEGAREVLQASYDRAHAIDGLPAMVQTHAGPIGAALRQGDTALEGLKRLQADLHPNGLWSCGGNPCIESTLGMAAIVQDMLIQSWSDPAKQEAGPIRVFPALPSAWKDVEFRDLRTEGAFLVSAKRSAGQTLWVKIKSLAGEPCRVRPGFSGKFDIKSERPLDCSEVSPGTYEIALKKNEEVWLLAAETEESYAVVVKQSTAEDANWRKVVAALQTKHNASIITYDTSVDETLDALQREFPRYTCFVTRPTEATGDFVRQVHQLTRMLDDDPYTDTFWGILTGYDADNALVIARHSEPLVVKRVASGTEIAAEMVTEGQWYDELVKNKHVKKEPGGKAVQLQGPDDTTKPLVELLNDYKADLMVTSGHATQAGWQIGFRFRSGQFRSQAGQMYGLDTQGKTFPIDSTNPKVYLPIGNCLMGDINGPDAMALAWMNDVGVKQMIGYTEPTWFGYMGWGVLDYFVEQPGRYTLTEAFFANNHALIHRLNDPATPSGDLRGLKFDRDVVAFYGDPKWSAKMAEMPKYYDQKLEIKDGIYTLTITPNRGEDSFQPVNTNGSQRGGRPIIQFLPGRIKDVEILAGEDLNPAISDDFILVPNPDQCDPNREYVVRFKATILAP